MSEHPPGGAPTGTTATPTEPEYPDRRAAFRGPETLGGLLLILAGIAAALSLLFDWLADDDISGWGLVLRAFDDVGGIVRTGLVQPLTIVLGGGVLFVLGLLLWLPARSHRFLGGLALLVTAGIIASLLVPLAAEGWDLGRFALGFWFALAVGALGLLGSLKALLTGPKYPAA